MVPCDRSGPVLSSPLGALSLLRVHQKARNHFLIHPCMFWKYSMLKTWCHCGREMQTLFLTTRDRQSWSKGTEIWLSNKVKSGKWPPKSTNIGVCPLRGGKAHFELLRDLHRKQADSLCHLGDNLQTAITVAKNSEMIPGGSQVILVEAKEPEDLVPASVTWQLVENQENGPEKNVSKC